MGQLRVKNPKQTASISGAVLCSILCAKGIPPVWRFFTPLVVVKH